MTDEEKPQPPMRLRVLHTPGDQFLIVLDRAEELNVDGQLTDLFNALADKMTGCGGVLVFGREVDMEAWYPYG